MTELIKKCFIKDYQNVGDPKVHAAYGKVAGFVGIISNFLLFILKITIGI